MNLRKNLGRVASTIVATALLASVATVPAFAVEGDTTTPQFDGTTVTEEGETKGDYTISMDKIIEVPNNVLAPNATFTFTANPDSHPENFDGVPVEAGVSGAVTIENAVSTSTNTEATEGKYTIPFDITVDLSDFDHAGVYKYLLEETQGTDSEITYDQQDKYLYVIIENDGAALKVGGVVVKDATTGNEGGDKSESFTNSYNGGNEGDTVDLTLTKTISGEAANMKQEFTFTISIDNGTAGQPDTQDNQVFKYWNDANKNKQVDEGETGYVTANSTDLELELGHTETVVIYGLRANDRYTITEGDEENAVSGGKTADGYTVKIDGTEDDDGSTNGTVAETDISVSYENKRDAVSPTGIVMNVAPYALLVVVAVAGCFVFLRKRNED